MKTPYLLVAKLVTWSVLFTILSCKHDSSTNVIQPNGQPRLLAMRIDGIPDENIQIDQTLNQITIQLPEGFTNNSLRPSLKLTPNSVAYSGQGTYQYSFTQLDLSSSYPEHYKIGLALSDQATNSAPSIRTEYTISIKSAGPIRLNPVSEPGLNEYTIGNTGGFLAYIENLYDGPYSTELTLTKHDDPAASVTIPTDFIRAENSATNWYRVHVPTNALKPGPYDLTVKRSSGRSAVSAQPLLIKKGPIAVEGRTPNIRSIGGEAVTVKGLNFFEDSHVEVELTHTDGTRYRRMPTRYEPYGTELAFVPGADVKPGQYTMRFLQNGQPATTCYRMAVTKTAEQPYIYAVGDANQLDYLPSGDDCYPASVLYVSRSRSESRNAKLWFGTIPLPPNAFSVRAKLVSAADPKQIDYSSLYVDTYTRTASPAYSATLIIPTSVPAGQYRLIVELTNLNTNKTYESEPYNRLIGLLDAN